MSAHPTASTSMLTTTRQVLRGSAYAPSTTRSLLYTVQFAAIAAGLFVANLGLERVGWPAWVVWPVGGLLAIFQGFAYQSLQIIGHDCGHGSFSKHALLNRWVGHLTSSAVLMNYAHWRRSHNLHHAHVQNIERDEAFGPKVRRKGRLAGPVQKVLRGVMLLPFFPYAAQMLLPFTDKLRTPGYPSYFWPSRERDSQVSFAFVLVHIAAIVCVAVTLGPAFALRAMIIPLLTAWSTFLLYTYLNHTGPNTVWYPDAIWRFQDAVHQTCNVSYGPVLNFFFLGVGTDHYAHHLQPRVPWYRLRKASERIGDAHPNNAVVTLGFVGAWATYLRWVWARLQHGYVTDDTQPFAYPDAKEAP